VRLTFDPAPLGGHDPRVFAWNVVYKGAVPNLTAKRDRPKKTDALGAAKGKDDADLYLFEVVPVVWTKKRPSLDRAAGW